MLNERELRVRRLAYELWERAGQRGMFADYLAFVEAELTEADRRDEAEEPPAPRDLPFF